MSIATTRDASVTMFASSSADAAPTRTADLDRGTDFRGFTAGYCVGASLVGSCDTRSAFGDVEAGALRGTCRFVAQFGVADLSVSYANEKLSGDVKNLEGVMRQRASRMGSGHAPPSRRRRDDGPSAQGENRGAVGATCARLGVTAPHCRSPGTATGMVTVRIIHRSISLDSLCVLNARGHRSGEKVNQMPSDAVGVIVLNARGHRSGEKPRCSRSLEALARASLQAHGATLLQGHGARETD